MTIGALENNKARQEPGEFSPRSWQGPAGLGLILEVQISSSNYSDVPTPYCKHLIVEQKYYKMKNEISPFSDMKSLYKVIRKAARVCGADVFVPSYRINIITVFMWLSIATFFIFAFYTICIKFHEDWKIIFETLCLAGGALQGTAKFFTVFMKQKQIRQLKDKIYEVYEYYETNNVNFRMILQESMKRIKYTIIFNNVAWLVAGIYAVCIPVYYKIFKNEQILLIQFLIPKIDPSTDFGYAALYAIQSTCIFFGLFGNMAGDTYFILNVLIILDKKVKNIVFRDIIKWTQETFDFSEQFISITFVMVSMEVFFCGVSAIFSVYIIMTGNWPAAYPYFVLNFIALYIYCFLGTAVDNAADKCIDIIYDMEWYNLDLKSRKMILLVLMKAQKKTAFTVGGVAPLSVNTALQVTKTIYSFFMMLMNFVE
ncbi:odorant receptor 67d-like [Condylostylus longicornis]|uniref:odorant receptor 67d-like n=1 Tax=Condylostylus longicornis TaxID=2530218 RepID=UPI00244E0978|nr:odorant receptor 67d-like [Condylostylus longicornis]